MRGLLLALCAIIPLQLVTCHLLEPNDSEQASFDDFDDTEEPCMASAGELDAKSSSILQTSSATTKVIMKALPDAAPAGEALPGTAAGAHGASPAVAALARMTRTHLQNIHEASKQPGGARPKKAANAAPTRAQSSDAVQPTARGLPPADSPTGASAGSGPGARAAARTPRHEPASGERPLAPGANLGGAPGTAVHRQPARQERTEERRPGASAGAAPEAPAPAVAAADAADANDRRALFSLLWHSSLWHAVAETASGAISLVHGKSLDGHKVASGALMSAVLTVVIVTVVAVGVLCSLEGVMLWWKSRKKEEPKGEASAASSSTPSPGPPRLQAAQQWVKTSSRTSQAKPQSLKSPATPDRGGLFTQPSLLDLNAARRTPAPHEGKNKGTLCPAPHEGKNKGTLCPDLVVPDETECILLIPRLMDTSGAAQLTVDDAGRVPVFRISVAGLEPASGRMPHRPGSRSKPRLVLMSASEDRVTFAHCQMGEANSGAEQPLMSIHDSSMQFFGSLRRQATVTGTAYQLVVGTGEQLSVQSPNFRDSSEMTISDKEGNLLVMAEQMPNEQAKRIVRIGPQVDVGVMVLCILGVDMVEHLTARPSASSQSSVFRQC